jgi:hypothetical protein
MAWGAFPEAAVLRRPSLADLEPEHHMFPILVEFLLLAENHRERLSVEGRIGLRPVVEAWLSPDTLFRGCAA